MTRDECNGRAAICAANAAQARSEPVALEFLRVAAQWRAMAARFIFLDQVGEVGHLNVRPTAIGLDEPTCRSIL